MQISRRSVVCSIALAALTGCAGEPEEELMARARAIHDAVMTIDTHDDIPPNFATEAVDPLDADRQVDLNKMRAGGLDVAS